MNELNKLRDELAAEHTSKCSAQMLPGSWLDGWNACLSSLEQHAGELSLEEIEWVSAKVRERYNMGFDEETNAVNLALWAYRKRFEQDRARVAQAIERESQAFDNMRDAQDTIKQLEARLSDSEQFLKVNRETREALESWNAELQDKIQARDARVRELEAERDKVLDMLNRQNDKLAAMCEAKRESPREFWINDNAEGDGTFNAHRTEWFGYIHVIEHSAYEALRKELDIMDAALAKADDKIGDLTGQLLIARKALEEIADSFATPKIVDVARKALDELKETK